MTIELWTPPIEPSDDEEFILCRLKRNKKLFAYLRRHRHEIFDESFQRELLGVYRGTGAGSPPRPPAMMSLAILLQEYAGASDAEAVELTVMDSRWQLVLGCLGDRKPAFSQGVLQQFRQRLIESGMDQRLLERTAEVARATKGFDAKKLPKELRVGMDSRPLVGAAKVEDTYNLLGHAARKIAECAADQSGLSFAEVCEQSHARVLLAPSIKAGLDIDWSDADQRAEALEDLVIQVRSLAEWVGQLMSGEGLTGPITGYIESLMRVQDQNLNEEDGKIQMRDGVAPDRQVSIEDPEMRHGRKNKNVRFNGYKEYVAADLDHDITLAATVLPANVPERDAGAELKAAIERQGFEITELAIDRGFISSPIVDELEAADARILCKPWSTTKNTKTGLFPKSAFTVDVDAGRATCPAGADASFDKPGVVRFDTATCAACAMRSQCTTSTDRGRTIRIGQNEQRNQRLTLVASTPEGRADLRRRTKIEHRLAHTANRKGPRAVYKGTRKNTYDLRRTCAVQNLEVAQRGLQRRAA